jgi:carboxyl-terminal processing protease
MKKLVLLFSISSLLLTGVSHAYRDISDTSTLRPAIDYFMEKDILDGNGFFRGEDTMPASWFWEIVLSEAGFDPASATFETAVPEGIDPDSPEAQYLREAIRRGFIDADEKYDPNRAVKRLEAIQFIVKTKGILPPSRTSDKFRAAAKGVPPIAKYLNEVEAAFASGILELGDLQPLKPHDTLKRKELVRWLHNWEKNGQKKESSLVNTQPRKSAVDTGTRYPYERRNNTQRDGARITVGTSNRQPVRQISNLSEDMRVLLEVLNQLETKFHYQDKINETNKKEWINYGIEALVDQVDEKYTNYIRPDKAEDYLNSLDGQFEGIGAYVEMIDDKFTIRSPIKGSPAEAAGLRPGDTVLEVDGEDIAEQTINEIIAKVKGPAGTDVTLKIQRNGRGVFEVTVTRGEITVPDITLETHKGIPVIGIHQFNRDTGPHIETMLREEVLPNNPRGIVFDLRNNPGGYLTAAVDVGSIFVGAGKKIFSVDYQDDSRDRLYETSKAGLLADFDNLAFLQNKGSASASEILNGMVQDYGIGKIIGQTSVGKGTVQEIVNFSNGGSLKVTVAEWITPSGDSINEVGVIPDIEITDPTDEEKLNKIDRQLDRAVEAVLRGE